MKCNVSVSALRSALKICASVVERKTTIPILGYALFRCENGQLIIEATDMEKAVRLHVVACVSEDGAIAIPFAKVNTIVGLMSEQDVSIKASKAMRVEMYCGKSVSRIPGLAPTDYPDIPFTGTPIGKVQRLPFLAAIKQARSMMGIEDTGARGMEMAFADSSVAISSVHPHRMYSSTVAVEDGVSGVLRFESQIGAADSFMSSCDDEEVSLFAGENGFMIHADCKRLYCRRSEIPFPSDGLRKILKGIPKDSFSVSPTALAQAIKRTIAFSRDANKDSPAVCIEGVDEGLKVSFSGASGDNEEIIEMPMGDSRPNFKINGEYVLALIGTMGSEMLNVHFKSKGTAVFFVPAVKDGPVFAVAPLHI